MEEKDLVGWEKSREVERRQKRGSQPGKPVEKEF